MRPSVAALTILVVLPLSSLLHAQPSADPVGRSAAGTWLRPGGDVWGALGASPLLGSVREVCFGAAYFPPAWGLAPLATSAAVAAFPWGPGTVGLSLSRFGSSLYSETEAGLAWGGGAGGLFLYGLSIRVRHLAIERYGNAWTPRVDLAVALPAGEWSLWGVRITDANRGAIGRSGERLGERLSLAAAFFAAGWPSLLLQAGDEDAGFALRAAVELTLDPLVLRAGASGDFTRIHAGLECPVGSFSAGYGVVVHPVLGWSHALWLSGGGGGR